MDTRFSGTQHKGILGLSLVPNAMIDWWKEEALEFADVYCDDLPDPETLRVELHCWKLSGHSNLMQGNVRVPKPPRHTQILSITRKIHELLQIICTLPVTSIDCKHSDSSLKWLKTYPSINHVRGQTESTCTFAYYSVSCSVSKQNQWY